MGLPPALASRAFGSLLRQVRIEAGLTQEALAERASLGVRSIQGLEQGESQPRLETIRRLADSLSLSGEKRERFEAAASPTPRRSHLVGTLGLRAPPNGEASTLRTNLPLQLTSFVGREPEIAEVRRLIGTTRLLTLVGSGGVGKTRLALQVASDLVDEYPEGVWAVELAVLSDPELLPQTAAFSLGVREQPGSPVLATLQWHLKPKRLLLVLDNCEHLLGACASLADSLLRACPSLRIIATSREPLGIAGETTWRVPSLSLPDPRHCPPTHQLLEYESIRLFAERASAARPDFQLTEQNAAAAVGICTRLDGMPLAIELAATRVRVLSVQQLAERLDDRFRLLTGGSRAALPRQQTLRAAIDWSYDLLSPAEAALFRRLAVFAGGWTAEAAEVVCSDEADVLVDGVKTARGEVLELLLRLVERSLVLAEEVAGEERYRLLETVRQYAWEKLLDSGQQVLLRDRHRDWCLELVHRAEPELQGPGSVLWLDHLETEHDNLRAALLWCLDRDVEAGLEIVGGLLWFWDSHCHYQEGSRWAAELLARSSAETLSRARALRTAGMMAMGEDAQDRAAEMAEENLRLCRKLDDKRELGRSLALLAAAMGGRGENDRAARLCGEAVAVTREVGDVFTLCDALW